MKQEEIVVGAGTNYPLKGLLTLPDRAEGRVPAVVLVHGSGASNRDERVGRLTPFWDLAEGLAARGIAAVRYDKRSFSHGWKMLRDRSGPLTVREETIEDALRATELLRRDARIDGEKVFLLGHSMGAMLAPRMDAEGGHYRGLILMAGTLRRLEEVLVAQTEELAASIRGPIGRLAGKQAAKLRRSFAGLYERSDEEAVRKKMGGGTTLYYFKEMGEHPAADYLLALNKPVFILQGGKDAQVKADVDFAAYQTLLKGRENVRFALYEQLNHAFVPARYGTIAKLRQEYGVEQHIGREVLDDLAQWIWKASAD